VNIPDSITNREDRLLEKYQALKAELASVKAEVDKWHTVAMKLLLPLISDSDVMALLNDLMTQKEKGGER
jgi:murein L,D-transpeptidase YcbB/YkuD